MLNRLLKQIAQGGIHSVSALAREFDVSEPLLVHMADNLVRMGYLKPVSGSCSGGCDACPVAGGCSLGSPDGLWVLTEKGMRAAQRE